MSCQLLTFDRSRQNDAGAKLMDPVSYHRVLWSRGGYVKASDIMWRRFHISFYIDVIS